jgi:hypothetical protein
MKALTELRRCGYRGTVVLMKKTRIRKMRQSAKQEIRLGDSVKNTRHLASWGVC